MDSPTKRPVEFSDHVVAYFDVLGQKEKLRQLKELSANDRDFGEIAHQTYFVVDELRCRLYENSRRCYSTARTYIDGLVGTTDDQKRLMMSQIESRHQFSFFSDCFAVTLPYRDDDGHPLIQHIFTLLVSLSGMMLTSISRGIPVRGAIEVGKGFEWPDGGVYGPITLDAYELESQTADYPRIVVGPELKRCVCEWDGKVVDGGSYYVRYSELIEACKGMISDDRDGISILDYFHSATYS